MTVTKPSSWPLEVNCAYRGPGDRVDERAFLVQQGADASPLAHDHFHLGEAVCGVFGYQVHHAGTAGTDGLDLGAMVLDVPVAGDDQPLLAGGFRDPDVIER